MVDLRKCSQFVTAVVSGVYNVNLWIINANLQFSVVVPVVLLFKCTEVADHMTWLSYVSQKKR